MQRSRPPKKSESLEIRLAYPTKLAFMARCRDDGRSASDVLRGFIEAHLETRAAAASRRRGLRLAAGAILAATVGAAALPSFARSSAEAEFARLDLNADAAVSFAELSRDTAVQVQVRTGGAAKVQVMAPAQPAAQARLRALILRSVFDGFDADRDGVIRLEEYRRRHPAGPSVIKVGTGGPAVDGSPRSRA